MPSVTRIHLRDGRHPTWSVCGQFRDGTRLSDDHDVVDCGHCRRFLERTPHPQVYSGKARWRALKALVARHPFEYAQLLDEADAAVRAEG